MADDPDRRLLAVGPGDDLARVLNGQPFQVHAIADDLREGMTLNQIAAFVTTARRAGLPATAVPRVVGTYRHTIEHLEVEPVASPGPRRGPRALLRRLVGRGG